MKVCKFCNFIDGVDFYAGHELIEKEFLIKTTGTFAEKSKEFEIAGKIPVVKDAYLSVYIDQKQNLCAYLDHETNTENEGMVPFVKIFKSKRKINFCPVCGRDLRKGVVCGE